MKAAYRGVPILPAHKRYVVIGCQNLFWIDHAFPFGLKPSSGAHGEVADATVDIWAAKAIGPSVKWVDDFVLARFPTSHDPVTGYRYAYTLDSAKAALAPLGIPWHPSKGQDFDEKFQYIGYLWSLRNKTVSLTDTKRSKYFSLVTNFLATHSPRKSCSKLNAMKINGSLSWVSYVYPDGRAYLTNLCIFISGFTNAFQTRHPNRSVFEDLEWWASRLSVPGVTRSLVARGDPVDLGFWMDASSSWGIGLICNNRWAAWKWVQGWESTYRGILWAEAVAVELAIRLLDILNISNIHVLIRTDNQGVLGSYERGRGRNIEVNNCIRRVEVIAGARNITSSFVYVASKDNLADSISRGIPGALDCHLDIIPLPHELTPFIRRTHVADSSLSRKRPHD